MKLFQDSASATISIFMSNRHHRLKSRESTLGFLDQRPAPDEFHWTREDDEVLTELQRTMAMESIHHHTTYRQLHENYRLSGPAQVRSILERTMHGNRCELGREFGGSPSFLSDVDTLLFRRLVEARTDQQLRANFQSNWDLVIFPRCDDGIRTCVTRGPRR